MRGWAGPVAMVAAVVAALSASPAFSERMPPSMRLGVNVPQIAPEVTDRALAFPSPQGTRNARVCRSWHAMVDRLGETFLAARMRRAVLPSACPLDRAETAHRWTWPWDEKGLAGDLPQLTRATLNAWSIRCGATPTRERCILAQSGRVVDVASGRGLPFTTHFVVDAVNGKERLIWRLYLNDADPERGSQIDWHRSGGRVDLTVAEYRTSAMFSVCSRSGCILEGDVASGAEIAKRLWDGVRAQIAVVPPSLEQTPVIYRGEIVAAGMKQALPLLTRLRQREAIPQGQAAKSPPAVQPRRPGETRAPSPRPALEPAP